MFVEFDSVDTNAIKMKMYSAQFYNSISTEDNVMPLGYLKYSYNLVGHELNHIIFSLYYDPVRKEHKTIKSGYNLVCGLFDGKEAGKDMWYHDLNLEPLQDIEEVTFHFENNTLSSEMFGEMVFEKIDKFPEYYENLFYDSVFSF